MQGSVQYSVYNIYFQNVVDWKREILKSENN